MRIGIAPHIRLHLRSHDVTGIGHIIVGGNIDQPEHKIQPAEL